MQTAGQRIVQLTSDNASLNSICNEQAETVRQLRIELAETKQAIAFWLDVNQLLAREKGHLLETVRQLRKELAETKQAMLLGVLSE